MFYRWNPPSSLGFSLGHCDLTSDVPYFVPFPKEEKKEWEETFEQVPTHGTTWFVPMGTGSHEVIQSILMRIEENKDNYVEHIWTNIKNDISYIIDEHIKYISFCFPAHTKCSIDTILDWHWHTCHYCTKYQTEMIWYWSVALISLILCWLLWEPWKDRTITHLPQKFDCLRHVPGYKDFMVERFKRPFWVDHCFGASTNYTTFFFLGGFSRSTISFWSVCHFVIFVFCFNSV